MDELKNLYLILLGKMWSIEDQLVERLPMMAQEANAAELREVITQHLEETKMQRDRLARIGKHHSFDVTEHHDMAFEALLSDAEDELEGLTDPNVRDAFIIAAAQTVEHLEIAKYGTLIEWSKHLEDDMAEDLLKETLGEEEAADKKLSGIAKGGLFTTGINEKATEE